MSERLLFSIPEAMTALGVGRTMLYVLVDNHDIIMVKIGRRSFITVKSVTDYVDRLSAAS